MNYLRNSEQMREWKGRKVYGSHLRPDGVCAGTLNLAPGFLAGQWQKETGWVSWLLSDKEAYQFFSGEKPRKTLDYKGAEFIPKECTFFLLHTFLRFCCCCLHCSSDLCLVRLSHVHCCDWCVYVLPPGLEPLTNRNLKAKVQELHCVWTVWRKYI